MKFLARLVVACLVGYSTGAEAYVPLLDEVEGISGNNGRYLILPAWENLDAGNRTHAYFIMPKYLVLAGNLDASQPEYQFGVSHRGYTLNNGQGDYPPSMDLLAAVTAYKNDADISKIQAELIKRDIAAGLNQPVFPDPVFSKFEGSAVVAGVSSPFKLDSVQGGYPGQLTLIHVVTTPDALPSLVLDLPNSAGRQAALWGVSFRGTIPGYGNRLDCTITIHHRKVYDHFKAQASGQAYWGLVKANVGTEIKSMDQDQAIDFGKCRGDANQIDKIVMPAWLEIVKLGDQDGNTMFADMVKSTNGIPNHPEAAEGGWGFQASAGWEKVSYSDSTTINFNISFRMEWELPLAMTFSTQCSRWKPYFINNSDTSKPCVDPNEFPIIRQATKKCYSDNLNTIVGYPQSVQKGAKDRLRVMGCAWDGSWSLEGIALPFNVWNDGADESTKSADQITCRQTYAGLVDGWQQSAKITDEQATVMLNSISLHGCSWNGSMSTMALHNQKMSEELNELKKRVRK